MRMEVDSHPWCTAISTFTLSLSSAKNAQTSSSKGTLPTTGMSPTHRDSQQKHCHLSCSQDTGSHQGSRSNWQPTALLLAIAHHFSKSGEASGLWGLQVCQSSCRGGPQVEAYRWARPLSVESAVSNGVAQIRQATNQKSRGPKSYAFCVPYAKMTDEPKPSGISQLGHYLFSSCL